MPRAARPAAPADDLAAARPGEPRHGTLTAELAAFCQSGISIVLGSRRSDGRPIAGRAIACTIGPGGIARLLLAGAPNRDLLAAVAEGAPLAATFTRPQDHRSIQLKSSRARVVGCAKGDRTIAEDQTRGFEGELTSVGYPDAFAATYCAWSPDDLLALEFTPESAFVQTPGPGAGSALP